MKEQVPFLGAILLVILVILIVTKTIYFFKATRRRTLKRWLFFSRFEIIESSSRRIGRIRKRQNIFSILILIYAAIAGIIYFLMLK